MHKESILGLKEPDNEYNRMRENLISHQRQNFDIGVICSIRTVSEANCKKMVSDSFKITTWFFPNEWVNIATITDSEVIILDCECSGTMMKYSTFFTVCITELSMFRGTSYAASTTQLETILPSVLK